GGKELDVVRRALFFLASLTPGFGHIIWPWFVVGYGGVLAYLLSFAVTREREWHPIAFVMIPVVLAAVVYVYRRMVGVSSHFVVSGELARFASEQGWRPSERAELPARGAPFTFGGDHDM